MAYRSYQGFRLNFIWTLIILNFILFIATSINRELIFLLGLNPAIFTDRPWTIVTSMFVHVDFFHIFANMMTFYFFGTYLTQLIGENKFLIVYFGGGILGSIFFILLASPFSIAVGASGAVFALGGALAVMRPKVPVRVFPIPAPIPLWTAVLGGFIILTAVSPLFRIAWQAHLGGIIFGLILGYFFKKRERYSFF